MTTPRRPDAAVTRCDRDTADFYDAELRRHDVHFRAAARVGPGDRVLDVGCGAGTTTRDAARAAVDGHATGVDVSAPMLVRARRLAGAEGLGNVAFEHGDAQAHRSPNAPFDLCMSRFGTMFFRDPTAAFANIGRALRPGGRLVLLVWQEADRNEWFTAVRRALAGATPPPPTIDDLEPFSLADPATTRRVLTGAGFAEVDLAPVHEPVHYGRDPDEACEAVLRLRHPRDLLADLDPASAATAVDRLRALLRDHDTGDEVLFGSAAWIVTARRP